MHEHVPIRNDDLLGAIVRIGNRDQFHRTQPSTPQSRMTPTYARNAAVRLVLHDEAMLQRTPAGFIALYQRLERASDVLREHGCLLQAIARRYYVVYTIATYLAAKYGIDPPRRREDDKRKKDWFSHGELPDLIRALYTGRRSRNVGPGSHSGVLGAVLTENEAVAFAARLQDDRVTADYGYVEDIEPYDARETDLRLARANAMIEDLKTLL